MHNKWVPGATWLQTQGHNKTKICSGLYFLFSTPDINRQKLFISVRRFQLPQKKGMACFYIAKVDKNPPELITGLLQCLDHEDNTSE